MIDRYAYQSEQSLIHPAYNRADTPTGDVTVTGQTLKWLVMANHAHTCLGNRDPFNYVMDMLVCREDGDGCGGLMRG